MTILGKVSVETKAKSGLIQDPQGGVQFPRKS